MPQQLFDTLVRRAVSSGDIDFIRRNIRCVFDGRAIAYVNEYRGDIWVFDPDLLTFYVYIDPGTMVYHFDSIPRTDEWMVWAMWNTYGSDEYIIQADSRLYRYEKRGLCFQQLR